jgi:Uma2 family endonuclease
MNMPAEKLDIKYNYKDYVMWPKNERWELIDGIPYDMSPAPGTKHQEISLQVTNLFYNFLKGKQCKVLAAPFDIRLPKANEKDLKISTIVQPDIVVVCDKSKLDEKGVRGAPDLAIEIFSPNTAKKDATVKFRLYENAGIREYWMIRPEENTVTIFKLDSANKYGRPEVYSDEDIIKVGIFENQLEINLKEVFGVEDAAIDETALEIERRE